MKLIIGLTMILLITNIAIAKDFGKQGMTFVVKEEGFLAMIMHKLKSLNIEEHQAQMGNIAKQRIEEPNTVAGIARAKKQQIYSYDPSYVLDEDIYLPNGKLLHAIGTRVNPLDHISWNSKLVFIDARDKTQVAWLKQQNMHLKTEDDVDVARDNSMEDSTRSQSETKIILVAGKPIELEQELGTNVYFDQFGELTSKFNITQVPAVVEQDGKYLKVTEIYIGDK